MADETSTCSDGTLLDLLQEQRSLYRRLRWLADRQRTLVTQDDPQGLLSLLAERQQLVDALVRVGARLAPYREQWTSLYAGFDEPSRRRVAELLEEANAALQTILQSDGRDSATLAARRNDLASRVASLDVAGRAAAAYGTAAPACALTDAKA